MNIASKDIDDKSALKEAKSEFKEKFEKLTLHIRVFQECNNLEEIVNQNLAHIEREILFSTKNIVIINLKQMKNGSQKKTIEEASKQLTKAFSEKYENQDSFRIATIEKNYNSKANTSEMVNIEEMTDLRHKHLKCLEDVGFFGLIGE